MSAAPSSTSSPAGLRQSLGVTHATAMVVGTIIGASIFAQPSEIAQHVPTGTGILLVWLGAGILTLFGALICAELTSAFPKTGGVYVFLKESWGASVGFLWGWAMLWGMHTGIIAIVAVIFARYTAVLVPMDPSLTPMLAVAVIAVLSAVNYVGVKHGGLVQNVFTGAKLVAIVAIIAAGVVWSGVAPAEAAQPAGSVRPFFLAMAAALFAYGGWHMVTYTAGETREAGRTIPRALLFGTLIVTLAYAGLNTIYLHVLPLSVVQTSRHVAADAADVVLGGGGASLMAGLVMVSTFGAVNGIILVGPRVYYSMAQDGLLFRWLGVVHPVYGTPARAIAIQAIGASILALTNPYTALVSRVIYTEWIFFAIMAAGLLRLRARRDYRPAYRIWGAPVLASCFILGSLVVVAVQILEKPMNSAAGLGIVLAGLPVYLLWSRKPGAGH
jgi:APA family basic amino acid/polyamine antiporter